MKPIQRIAAAALACLPGLAAASGGGADSIDLTGHWVGPFSIGVFMVAYALVMAEEFTHLRKSKPVIIAAGIIWAAIAWVMVSNVRDEHPAASGEEVAMQRGAKRIIALFIATIATAVSFLNFLHLPPVASTPSSAT